MAFAFGQKFFMDGRAVSSSRASDCFSPAWSVPIGKDPVLEVNTQILPLKFTWLDGQEEKEETVDVTFYKLVPKKENATTKRAVESWRYRGHGELLD